MNDRIKAIKRWENFAGRHKKNPVWIIQIGQSITCIWFN